MKDDNFKVDLESAIGISAFKKFLQNVSSLIEVIYVSMQLLDIQTECRDFRNTYTKAYRVLYEDTQLGYIPEIFDAAQEGFPYIWVNGECYIFESATIQKGEKLV